VSKENGQKNALLGIFVRLAYNDAVRKFQPGMAVI
jgi:hypothetical protein